MATLRDIRRRIRAVRSTQQITRAMYLVAAAKLKKAEMRARAGRPYARRLEQLVARVGAAVAESGAAEHPLLQTRPVRRLELVVVTADRGLAGAYNANVIRAAEQLLRGLPADVEPVLTTVGRKGRDYFRRRRRQQLLRELVGLGEEIEFTEARELARQLVADYLEGRADEVRLLYTEYISPLRQRPTELVLLPVVRPAGEEDERGRGARRDYLFEPSAEQLRADLLPKYVELQVYRALAEAKASEHGARMTAMKNATDNAQELIETLTLDLNRARQAAITREIAEIVGGAEALKG